MIKNRLYFFFILLLTADLFASRIWETPLHRDNSGVHFARNTIQNTANNTDGIFRTSAGHIVPVMPFLSTYSQWPATYQDAIPGIDPSERDLQRYTHNNYTYPLLAVKLDQEDMRKLPRTFLQHIGADPEQTDFFLNVQGYPPVHNHGEFNNVLLQPHTWMFASIPGTGGINAETQSRIYRYDSGTNFNEVAIRGSQAAHAHDGTLSGNTRHIADLALNDGFNRADSRIYLSTVKMGTVTQGAHLTQHQPEGRAAVTLHVLLSDNDYTTLRPYFIDSYTGDETDTLNNMIDIVDSVGIPTKYNEFLHILREIRDEPTLEIQIDGITYSATSPTIPPVVPPTTPPVTPIQPTPVPQKPKVKHKKKKKKNLRKKKAARKKRLSKKKKRSIRKKRLSKKKRTKKSRIQKKKKKKLRKRKKSKTTKA